MPADRSLTCPRCSTSMEKGFVVDHTYGAYTINKWFRGRPRVSFWTGIKVRIKDGLPLTTYRCSGCGYLESYAPTD